MPNSTSTPPAVSVSRYGELRGDPKRGAGRVLRVCVDGQHAGFIERDGQVWRAIRQPRVLAKSVTTEHASVEDALRAVLRSGFARQLGARPASPVFWSAKARAL